MLVLESFYRKRLFLLVLLVISCRKKIDHTEGTTTSYHQGNQFTIPSSGWEKISDEGLTGFYTLQVFNDELYAGGTFKDTVNNFNFLGKLDQNGKLVQGTSLNLKGFGVYDLAVANNELIIGGGFYTNPISLNANLTRMNASGTITSIPFSKDLGTSVYCILPVLNDLYIGGYFSPSATNYIVTKNVEKLVNFSPVGTANSTDIVYNLSQINSAIMACGASGKLMGWNGGTTWTSENYINKSAADNVVAGFMDYDNYYLVGNFSYGKYTMKVRDQYGDWNNVLEVKHTGNISSYSKMKKIGQDVFLFGKAFSANNEEVSSIIMLSGSSWYTFSDLHFEVRDIEFFNGSYYIATNYGLFKY